ncbi:ABC transporter substrate-binding protein [Massilia sp.]|uniref:ABC transporter substrate-binding protein n=1 Tax=Massilia sp. TaxID=1882437 RepID=UPI00352DC7F4
MFAFATLSCFAQADDAEVLHYWQPDDTGTALLKDILRKQGHEWKDFVVLPGGKNGLLNGLLKARILSGNPPFAAVIRAPVARDWGRAGSLTNLDDISASGKWDSVLPRAVRDAVKDRGHYIAVPINMYQENGLWVNNRLLKRVGADVPHDWPGFFAVADKLRQAGIVALAHGGQQRGNLHLFASVALGVGGPQFYRRAFVSRDPAALSGRQMEQVLQTFRRVKSYVRPRVEQLNWPDVSRDVIDGKAAMVFIGGWTGPMFEAEHARTGFDFSCVPAPGTGGAFAYVIDSFALFGSRNPGTTRAQKDFAASVLSPEVQVSFNRERGSIPARFDVDLGTFHPCQKQAAAAFRKAEENDTLVPSFAIAVPADTEVALAEAVTAFWADDSMSTRTAMARIATALK